MWDCEECGCQAIAGSIEACPMCSAERPMPEADVPAPDQKAQPGNKKVKEDKKDGDS